MFLMAEPARLKPKITVMPKKIPIGTKIPIVFPPLKRLLQDSSSKLTNLIVRVYTKFMAVLTVDVVVPGRYRHLVDHWRQ